MVVPASWIPISPTSDFSLQNLPFSVFSPPIQTTSSSSSEALPATSATNAKHRFSSTRRCATIVGDTVIDLALLEEAGLFSMVVDDRSDDQSNKSLHNNKLLPNTFSGQATLNKFIAQPKPVWTLVRQRLLKLLVDSDSCNDTTKTVAAAGDSKSKQDFQADRRLRENPQLCRAAFYPVDTVQLHLPVEIGEYTDFYSSREHATNVGIMFRGKDNALQPNWLHLPVGYHGRASTVMVSGHSFPRPCGQIASNGDDNSRMSHHAPTQRLDFELEVGMVVGGPSNPVGQPLSMVQAHDRIFGFVLLNDWSARDIQKFEYVPLGPFTSKNFATTISPWIVTQQALEPFCVTTPPSSTKTGDDLTPLPYLLADPNTSPSTSYDVHLSVAIQSKNQDQAHVVCRSNMKHLYWNFAQQLVHHTVTGCSIMPGNILGTGTISGSTSDSFGSLLELSWNGTQDVWVGGTTENRKDFLHDGDTVILRGFASLSQDEVITGRVGFGDCRATVLPPLEKTSSMHSQIVGPTTDQQTHDRYTNVKLYGFWRSSSTWRVRIVLAAKSISYETIPINLEKGENKSADYLVKNPLGQVPLLELFDTETQEVIHLTQSSAIIDFLEDAFPDRQRLVPGLQNAYARGVARQMVEIINSGTQPLQNQYHLKRIQELSHGSISKDDEAKWVNEQGLKALEIMVKKQRPTTTRNLNNKDKQGPFCLGTFAPTIADVYMVPQLSNARRFGVDVEKVCPTLVEIDALCSRHPWFVGAEPEAQPDKPKAIG
ncbi:hypothetical protein ACA910_017463 [Epithemia clementina (nom. ined.)]